MDPNCLIPGDATLIENIVNYLKAKGIFDEFRHECLADIDTKSSCQNLSQRVDGYTSKFLGNETWHPDLNKNELRNKLRRNIDEAGFLAPGADIVVEQAVNPKVYHYFFPKVIEVVHQYIKEQSEFLNKKSETTISCKGSSVSEKPASDAFENKDKTQISDPIADILSFSLHAKNESTPLKYGDTSKGEKKKDEKNIPAVDKIALEVQGETITASINETKVQLEKDKIKKEDSEIQQDVLKKTSKDEIKSEKKKTDDVKISVNETATTSEESKLSVSVVSKPNVSSKKDDKTKHKSKSQNLQKSSASSSEIKKHKRETSEKTSEKSEKLNKSKPAKPSKESPSPTKISSSMKSVFKDEKGESSRTKSHDSSSSKTPESSVKKVKSNYDRKESSNSKHKGHGEKNDKTRVSKSTDKNEPHIHHDSSNSEKSSKNIQYSSSYDSSQGSDQEKSTSTNLKKERSKHFSKHASKENSDNSSKNDIKRSNSGDESPSKKYKSEKDAKLKLKDTTVEAAKINSRSNSFGSTSSVSSSSNASKDNLTSNSDEVSENSVKDKKKKLPKERDSCQNSPKTLPPPPPPPPPSSSLTSELPSSAEMSSTEDPQSSLSNSETSNSEEISGESSSDSELESQDLINDTLNENSLNSSTDNINAFYDIFLYSSSSSEFEGYGTSPEKKSAFERELENMHECDLSVSSVHTSDLSSFDDELSSDDEVALLTGGLKKRLTLKEAKEIIDSGLNEENKVESKTEIGEDSSNKRCYQKPSSVVSSEDELPSPEPVRSLRRERKLNPRYSSSEYTSIFNCKKETFITKQTSPSLRNQTSSSSPKIETRLKKTDSFTENNKIAEENLVAGRSVKMHSDEIETSKKSESKPRKESKDKDDQFSDGKMSSSDELDSIIDTEKLFKENNKNNIITDDEKLKDHKKLKTHNNNKARKNCHSLKRKLEDSDSTPVKRPCSRSSVDSSSSEFVANENKPFNSEKKDSTEEKKLNDCSLKVSNINIGVKKDLFCRQRTNNNGDILGQKDIFPKNSHSKVINNSEKKTNDSDTGKELSSL